MGILDKINEKVNESNEKVSTINSGNDSEDKPNVLFASIISIFGIISSLTLFVSLFFAFSYDLCIILDSYYLYIVGVLGVLMLISIYICLKALKEKMIVISIINITLSLIAIIIFIIPLLTGLLYF